MFLDISMVQELYLESSGSPSYHFLHKTVQEFMAALHVSSLPPGERAEFVRTSFGKSNMTMVVRFMAGLTKLQSQDDIEGVLAFQKKGGCRLVESLHWLFEAHDPGLVQKCMGDREWTLELVQGTLNPFDCYVVGGQSMKMLMMVEKGRAFDYIKTMDLQGNEELGDEGAIVLGTVLRENKVLTSLGLEDCGLGPGDIFEVCSALGVNTTLTSLNLSRNTFDDQSIASLGKMLRENKVLTSLGLENCELGPKGLCEVCSALGVNTTLTSLNLSWNKFDDQSIASLVQLLTNNQMLKDLTLMLCDLDDDAVCSLVKGLEHCKLMKLDLRHNYFTTRMARKAIWCRPLVEKDVAWVCLHSLNLATQQCDDMGELEWGDQRDEMNCSSEAGSTPPQNGENDVPCEIIPDLQPATATVSARVGIKDSRIQIALEGADLWRRFNAVGTEMIISKAGR
eukprot:Em0748g2a